MSNGAGLISLAAILKALQPNNPFGFSPIGAAATACHAAVTTRFTALFGAGNFNARSAPPAVRLPYLRTISTRSRESCGRREAPDAIGAHGQAEGAGDVGGWD